jgi:uncharacterized membrane protein YraQ (UPF0718 family)
MSCCCKKPEPDPAPTPSCCATQKRRIDWLLWISLALVTAGLIGHFSGKFGPSWWQTYAHGTAQFMHAAWWGIIAGIIAVGIVGRLPNHLIAGILGKGGTLSGILRATSAGILLDLCNHGILMIGAQLYRKGASLGQTLAFLVASPWNSLSLTLILASLIGWKWMLLFLALSMLIGIITGWLADLLVKRGTLPPNPNHFDLPADFKFKPAIQLALTQLKPNPANLKAMAIGGLTDSRMILRWIFFGVVLASLVRALVPTDSFATYFGPSLLGLALTLVATTLIEVCTEGSSPIAADLLNRGGAPGNAFTFLMAGAATDYTEILVLRETTQSWKATLALPLLTVPQVLIAAWLLNSQS